MSDPAQSRVADAAKKTVPIYVRLTRVEAQGVAARARQHDPPTVSAWVRDLIRRDLARPQPPAS